MRRATLTSAGLFLLSASLVLFGCDNSKSPEEKLTKPAAPSIEVAPNKKQDEKSKNSQKLVKDSLDDLPQPVRNK